MKPFQIYKATETVWLLIVAFDQFCVTLPNERTTACFILGRSRFRSSANRNENFVISTIPPGEHRDITWNLTTNNFLHFISRTVYFAHPVVWCYAYSGTDSFLQCTKKQYINNAAFRSLCKHVLYKQIIYLFNIQYCSVSEICETKTEWAGIMKVQTM
jgi:hypothetical protein